MNNPSSIEGNLKNMLDDMVELKGLRDKLAIRKGKRDDEWIKKVDSLELEVDQVQKEFNELKSGWNAKDTLNRKVVGIWTLVKAYTEAGKSISDLIKTLFSNFESDKSKRFAPSDLRWFTENYKTRVDYGFGDVYKGELLSGVKIAVKKLEDSDLAEETFIAEVNALGKTYHRNLVRLYGFCFEKNMKAVVYEYMEKGSLDKILYDKNISIEWTKLYGIAIETARAISYLHEGCHDQIIHHDLRPCNVLLDSKLSPRVTDFGVAKLMNREVTHLTLSKVRGIRGYAAPEIWVQSSPITCKCDVYSFGIMLLEILGRRRIIEGGTWFLQQVWQMFLNKKLDEIMDNCGIDKQNRKEAEILTKVAFWCAQYTPNIRPSMSTVVKMLEMEIPVTEPTDPFPRQGL